MANAPVRGFVALLLLMAALAFAQPAAAQSYEDCPGGGVAKRVAQDIPDLKCVEVLQTQTGPLRWRIVRDASTPEKTAAAYRNLVAEALQRSLDAWTPLYPFKLNRVTILPVPKRVKAAGLEADFQGQVLQLPNAEADCIIEINEDRLAELAKIANEKGVIREELIRPDHFPGVISHEFAHCLQYWNWFEAASAKSSSWWQEGQAELLNALAYPSGVALKGRYSKFIAEIGSKPITQQLYPNVVFFKWLFQRNPQLVFSLPASMPKFPADGEAGQVAALLDFVGKPEFQQFARDLADGTIAGPGGAVPPLIDPAPAAVSGKTSVGIGGKVLTVRVRTMSIDDQAYALSATAAPKGLMTKLDGGGWAEMPSTLPSVECGKTRTLVSAMTPVSEGEAQASINFAPQGKCKEKKDPALSNSVPLAAVGSCPAGEWIVDNGAYAALLASRQGNNAKVQSVNGEIRMIFDPSGSARFSASGFTAVVKTTAEPSATVTVTANGTDQGSWEAADGALAYSSGNQAMKFQINVKVLIMNMAMPETHMIESGNFNYACQGDSMQLTYAGPVPITDGNPPHWVLHRVE
jgi:hypothetical protein